MFQIHTSPGLMGAVGAGIKFVGRVDKGCKKSLLLDKNVPLFNDFNGFNEFLDRTFG